jgi:hypothetical protein
MVTDRFPASALQLSAGRSCERWSGSPISRLPSVNIICEVPSHVIQGALSRATALSINEMLRSNK